MATVNVTQVFLNDAADPSDYVAFDRPGDGYSVVETRGGGVEGGYASGRRRGWSTAERSVTVQGLTLNVTTAEQRAWLVAHLGVTVCLRDHLGHKVFGRYQDVPVTVSTLPVGHQAANNAVPLTLQSVTWSEVV